MIFTAVHRTCVDQLEIDSRIFSIDQSMSEAHGPKLDYLVNIQHFQFIHERFGMCFFSQEQWCKREDSTWFFLKY